MSVAFGLQSAATSTKSGRGLGGPSELSTWLGNAKQELWVEAMPFLRVDGVRRSFLAFTTTSPSIFQKKKSFFSAYYKLNPGPEYEHCGSGTGLTSNYLVITF